MMCIVIHQMKKCRLIWAALEEQVSKRIQVRVESRPLHINVVDMDGITVLMGHVSLPNDFYDSRMSGLIRSS